MLHLYNTPVVGMYVRSIPYGSELRVARVDSDCVCLQEQNGAKYWRELRYYYAHYTPALRRFHVIVREKPQTEKQKRFQNLAMAKCIYEEMVYEYSKPLLKR